MALGAMTLQAESANDRATPLFMDVVSFAGDDAYPTGGSAFDAAIQALTTSGRDPMAVVGLDCGGYVVAYDRATGKMKVYTSNGAGPAALAEVPNATDLSATTFNVLVISK